VIPPFLICVMAGRHRAIDAVVARGVPTVVVSGDIALMPNYGAIRQCPPAWSLKLRAPFEGDHGRSSRPCRQPSLDLRDCAEHG